MALTVMNMPSSEFATTGCIYVHPSDARAAYTSLGSFVYRCSPHPGVSPGHVALNAIQRRLANVSVSDQIQIEDFLVPMRAFDIRVLSIQAEWVKVNAAPPPQDLTALANAFRTHFTGHVLSSGQKVCMNYDGNPMLFTVKNDVKGLVTMHTQVSMTFTP